MRKNAKEELTAEKAIASGAWSLPAWHRLKRQVEQERTQCWLLVAMAALTMLPTGALLGFGTAWPILLFAMLSPTNIPGLRQAHIEGLGASLFAVLQLVGSLLSLLVPAGIVLLANYNYKRQHMLTVRDLIYGNAALVLVDEAYGRLVEETTREHYRPNPNHVDFGGGFISQVNHFAHYYAAYYRLSWGPADITVPYTVERNCWSEGPLLGVGFCTTPIMGLGLLLVIPVVLRIVFVWTRVLAVKQAVVEYFGGRYDAALDEQAHRNLR